MDRPATRLTLTALGLAMASLFTLPAQASGGDGYEENSFAPEHHVPTRDLSGYAAGRLGVLPGSYWRVFLALAWRAGNGHPLSADETAALRLDQWRVGPTGTDWTARHDDAQNGVAGWLAAREQAGGRPVKIEVERATPDYSFFLNCPVDAFNRARQTLAERQRQSAATPPWVARWLAQQDAVFANCSPEGLRFGDVSQPPAVLPPALPADAPAWLRADHAYQTAAALFYAGQYQAARQRFLAIALDGSSPWQPLGAYLAARCLLRQATLAVGPDRQPEHSARTRQWLETARQELQAQAPHDAPAGALLTWVDARLRPAERASELGRTLDHVPLDAAAVRALSDYLVLLDGLEQSPGLMQAADPMTRWIGAMQAGDDTAQAAAMALARREGNHAPAGSALATLWLAPLLSHAQPAGTAPAARQLSPAERRAAEAVPPSAPLYLHLRYHLLRLQIQAGQAAAADAEVSRLLAHPPQPMDRATRNRWLALKLVTAPTLEGFLAAAPRQRAEPEAGTPIARADAASAPASSAATTTPPDTGLDEDFPRRLYRALPLSVLKTLPGRADLPPALKTELIEAVWTRAVLLGDWATADTWAPTLAQGRATTAALYTRFVQARTPEAKRLAATVIFVNTPELHPHRINPQGNPTEWGCAGWGTGEQDPLNAVLPAFLSPAQQAEARREQAVLDALPNRNAYLAPTLLTWAQGKPADPEAPKALHFFVASTRNECRPPLPANGQPLPEPTYSREAFRTLHRLWPDSGWARSTKYYYGGR